MPISVVIAKIVIDYIAKPNIKHRTKRLFLGGMVRSQLSRLMTKPTNDSAPSEDTDQPGHPPSLIRVFVVHSMGS